MQSTDWLGKHVDVVIDRPIHSLHPKWGYRYTLNYGYVPGTRSGDGEELDAYILDVNIPLKEFHGICIAVIQRVEEDDDKLIVVPRGVNLSNDEIRRAVNFQEKYFTTMIIRE